MDKLGVRRILRGTIPTSNDSDEEASAPSNYSNWASHDSTRFVPTGKAYKVLPSGYYEPRMAPNIGPHFQKIQVKTEGLLRFPETNSDDVLEGIQTFWQKKEEYLKYDVGYRRGLLLYGPAGSGKSSTIQLVLSDVIKRNGVALKFENPYTFIECARIFRNVQPETPMLVLMEDIDSIIDDWSESEVLNILDGVERIDGAVFLATTNYPEKLAPRIINRPSRFDRRYKMPHPGVGTRKMYFEHLFQVEDEEIEKWVLDTDGMSMAHLKELFVSVRILGNDYSETLDALKKMTEEKLSSDDDTPRDFGFKKKYD
jgi:SpoVK/Ycf46/Vps4 family AAA+-type ATPase